ncbi:energy-coupling factor transporter ATP-binding protein EcfA2 [Bradyrhizobium elkanii]|nr:energy-coupling factor transporter ATP-binding protein EcfA2 [Bradyrhizobium elkanii]
MVSFPVFQTLTIENYGLFPSSYASPFNVSFNPGQTVIVGVNGSGKSTMIALLLRMITGPFDLPSGRSDEELGQIRPEAARFDKHERSYFSLRVADGAKNARARLVVKFGAKALAIQRRLSDLGLVSASVAREAVPLDEDETGYQKALAGCMGVDTFFDALIILRYLTFMLEDRRSLVWDKTAQRQIFRVLVLPPEDATRLAVAQQQLISADSAYRNTFNMITRRRKEQEQASNRVQKLHDVEAELRIKQAEVNANRDQLERVGVLRIRFDRERREARLQRLNAAEAREASLRELERIKMHSLKHWFEPSNQTAHYIIAHLLAERQCLVCGADPAPNAGDLEKRISEGTCPVCGSVHALADHDRSFSNLDVARIQRLEKELRLAEQQIVEAENKESAAIGEFVKLENDYEDIKQRSISLDQEIVHVLKRMPAERAALSRSETEIDVLDNILRSDDSKRERAAKNFQKQTVRVTENVQHLQDRIAGAFQRFITLFVKEEAALVYQTVQERVAQGIAMFAFPIFRLAMTGGSVAGLMVREGPDSVSQSQAEFVDLAFRMALMTVAAPRAAASLVVDAPEASLDFLFATRAGQQLSAFASSHAQNRVIVTSYLPSQHFVTAFIAGIKGQQKRRERIVDLISDAAANAAMRADSAKYSEFLDNIIKGRRP